MRLETGCVEGKQGHKLSIDFLPPNDRVGRKRQGGGIGEELGINAFFAPSC